jgi:AraC-like DNA-binding protein
MRYAHFAFLAVCGLMIFLYKIGNQEIESIYPTQLPQFEINTTHEFVDSNWTSTAFSEKKDGIHFQYRLNTIHPEAFATLYFHKKGDDSIFYDLTRFNRIHISIKTKSAKRIPFVLTVDVPGFTKKNDPLSHVHLVEILECRAGENHFLIPFNKMEVPNWWLQYHQLDQTFLKRIDFARTTYFMLSSDQLINRGIEDAFIIQSIRLENNISVNWLFWFAWITIIIAEEILIRIKKKTKTEILISPSFTAHEANTETDKIEMYIAVHYSNQELEIAHIQKATGISSRKISTLLQEKFSMSFTDYVNQIRIAEVKRLLRESKAPISTIAYQVGFSNVSHFNRVFKILTGKSPSQFRDEG